MIRDHTKIKRIKLSRHWHLIVERSVYGPKSKATGFSLKSKAHVVNVTLHRFRLDGTDGEST